MIFFVVILVDIKGGGCQGQPRPSDVSTRGRGNQSKARPAKQNLQRELHVSSNYAIHKVSPVALPFIGGFVPDLMDHCSLVGNRETAP